MDYNRPGVSQKTECDLHIAKGRLVFMPQVYQHNVVAKATAMNVGNTVTDVWVWRSEFDIQTVREIRRTSIHETMAYVEMGQIDLAN